MRKPARTHARDRAGRLHAREQEADAVDHLEAQRAIDGDSDAPRGLSRHAGPAARGGNDGAGDCSSDRSHARLGARQPVPGHEAVTAGARWHCCNEDPLMEPMDDEYLWDRTGPPDEDVARLEALLAQFAAPPAEEWAPLALPVTRVVERDAPVLAHMAGGCRARADLDRHRMAHATAGVAGRSLARGPRRGQADHRRGAARAPFAGRARTLGGDRRALDGRDVRRPHRPARGRSPVRDCGS